MELKFISAGVLNVAYYEAGPANGVPTVLLHGFPYDAHAYNELTKILVASGNRCIVPFLRGNGATRFLSEETFRSGEQAALGTDLLALLDALSVEKAVLGGYDWGGRSACIVAALWPERVLGLVSCGSGYNIQDIAQNGEPVSAGTEARLWYQYYFHTERGRKGLIRNRRDVCRYLWKTWSPTWTFDDETFERSATAFDNPDFVNVVIHSYRHRYGVVAGDPALEAVDAQLAKQPKILVPTIVLDGGDDGVTPPSSTDEAARQFGSVYEREIVPGAGHNLPQERPIVFAKAILKLSRKPN